MLYQLYYRNVAYLSVTLKGAEGGLKSLAGLLYYACEILRQTCTEPSRSTSV